MQNKHLLKFWESKKDLLADFIEQETQERLEKNAFLLKMKLEKQMEK